jgi:hypothetical protein
MEISSKPSISEKFPFVRGTPVLLKKYFFKTSPLIINIGCAVFSYQSIIEYHFFV